MTEKNTSHISTQLIHHGYTPPPDFQAPQPGIFKASTVFFPNVAAMRQRDWKDKSAYTYGTHGTPSSFTLEERLCALEGGKHCVLTPSGLTALAVASFAVLKSGDHILLPDNSYGPNKVLAEGELTSFGISHAYYDAMDPQDLASKIKPNTRLVWLEAPGSVSMEFPDLIGLIKVCQSHRVLTALDNTWGAGIAFKPFDLLGDGSLSVDLTAHALTKYPSGGGDVLMGSVMTCNDELALKLKMTMSRLGICVGPNDIESILRSLPTISLRYAAQDHSARELAQWWKGQKACVQVLHPAVDGSPGHLHWQALCASDGGTGHAAGLFSVMLHPSLTQAQVDAFCDSLTLFRLGYSWGGPISLVVPYNIASMRSNWPLHLQQGYLVRFSTGFEDPQDLIHDLAKAVKQCLNF